VLQELHGLNLGKMEPLRERGPARVRAALNLSEALRVWTAKESSFVAIERDAKTRRLPPAENLECRGGRRLYAFWAARTLMLAAEHAVRRGASGILRGGGTAMRHRDKGKRLRARHARRGVGKIKTESMGK
jgi:hypothetical protein